MLDPWMSVISDSFRSKKNSLQEEILEIEDFFECILNHHVVLVPSARAGLSALMQYYQVKRGDKIFVPDWSSHCVISTLGAYGGLSYKLDYFQKIALAVHKFGYQYKLAFSGTVIEDSVDSLFEDGNSLFLNGSEVEVISLPKTMGTNSGGLVVTKNKKIKDFILASRLQASSKLAALQFERKLKFNQGKEVCYWGYEELQNFQLTTHEVNEIVNKLPIYLLNLEIIKKRFEQAVEAKIIQESFFQNGRYGTSLFFKKMPNNFLIQHFNISESYNNADFKSGAVMPIHLMVSDEEFELKVKELQNF